MNFLQGLSVLKQCLQGRAESEFLIFEARLLDILHKERLFGTTAEVRAQRFEVLYQLNSFAQQYCGTSFNDMCLNVPPKNTQSLFMDSSKETPTNVLPVISLEWLTHVVPTSYSSLLNAITFPLVTVVFDNTSPYSQDALLNCHVSIEEYSYRASEPLSVPKGTIGRVTLFPILIPSKIKELNIDRSAAFHVLVEYTLPFQHKEYSTEKLTLQARNTALLGQKGAEGYIDLTRYLAAWVTPHYYAVEQLLNVASKYLPEYGFRGYVDAPTFPEMADFVREQVQAIFKLLKYDRPLTYVDASFSLVKYVDQITQRVHLPSETLSLGGSANCLDGTILFASLLETICIAPLIVLVPGHALLGWKIYKDDEQEEERLDDVDIYEFLETTAIRDGDFATACASARKLFTNALAQGLFARDLDDIRGCARLIDVAVCRKKGIPPLE